MARSLRSAYVDPRENAIFYIRCRTKKSLILPPAQPGSDPDTHRVRYIEDLIRQYAGLFGISVHAHAVMRREFRIVLQSRPEVVLMLSDYEIARRWLSICPTLSRARTPSPEPAEEEIDLLCGQPLRIADLRDRLSSISWWMRLLQQRVAQLCNREDKTEGRVWNGRFRAVLLLDGTAHLAALVNVDLAAVRVSTGKPVSVSEFTSAVYRRQEQLAATDRGTGEKTMENSIAADGTAAFSSELTSDVTAQVRDGQHLAPIVSGDAYTAFADRLAVNGHQHRSSEDRVVNSDGDDYRKLLQLTHEGFPGAGPSKLPERCSLLSSLKIHPNIWIALVGYFDDLFSHVAGKLESMNAHVPKTGDRRAYVRPAARAVLGNCNGGETAQRVPQNP
ncbi:MAG: hypothetical protein ACKOEO_17665 [Planctomycetaceae bacterium]